MTDAIRSVKAKADIAALTDANSAQKGTINGLHDEISTLKGKVTMLSDSYTALEQSHGPLVTAIRCRRILYESRKMCYGTDSLAEIAQGIELRDVQFPVNSMLAAGVTLDKLQSFIKSANADGNYFAHEEVLNAKLMAEAVCKLEGYNRNMYLLLFELVFQADAQNVLFNSK